MATITSLPDNATIIALRGKLDFYCYRGTLCVRSWPQRPAMPRSPAVQLTAETFRSYSIRLALLGTVYKNMAIDQSSGTRWTWKDLTTRAAYGNLHTT